LPSRALLLLAKLNKNNVLFSYQGEIGNQMNKKLAVLIANLNQFFCEEKSCFDTHNSPRENVPPKENLQVAPKEDSVT